MAIRNIVLVGANGRLGPSILQALLSNSSFKVTVLSRQSSSSTYPSSVKHAKVSDDFPVSEVSSALQSQDAVIVTTAGSNDVLQIRLADAAAQAGVQRFIPADFGSCDSAEGSRALKLMPLYRAKKRVREHLQRLVEGEGATLSWTSIVCGHFFDDGLASGLLGFNLKERKVELVDGGEVKWSSTTLGTIGEAVVQVLERPDESRNKLLYIQSFCVSQNQILGVLERVVGSKFEIERVDSEEYIVRKKKEVDENPENKHAREDLVSIVGIVDSNWEKRRDFANGLLGIRGDDLEEVVRRVVEGQK